MSTVVFFQTDPTLTAVPPTIEPPMIKIATCNVVPRCRRTTNHNLARRAYSVLALAHLTFPCRSFPSQAARITYVIFVFLAAILATFAKLYGSAGTKYLDSFQTI